MSKTFSLFGKTYTMSGLGKGTKYVSANSAQYQLDELVVNRVPIDFRYYSLHIDYVIAGGGPATQPYQDILISGTDYAIQSPTIPGYIASTPVIQGVLRANTRITVAYSAEIVPLEIAGVALAMLSARSCSAQCVPWEDIYVYCTGELYVAAALRGTIGISTSLAGTLFSTLSDAAVVQLLQALDIEGDATSNLLSSANCECVRAAHAAGTIDVELSSTAALSMARLPVLRNGILYIYDVDGATFVEPVLSIYGNNKLELAGAIQGSLTGLASSGSVRMPVLIDGVLYVYEVDQAKQVESQLLMGGNYE